MIALRQMTMNDADRMLEWKNYPETREFAIQTHEVIKKENHIKWLYKNLIHFRIIECDGEVCGAVRVQDNDVSIWIDREFWGKGIATGVIKMVSKEGTTAKIVAGNIASLIVFIKAGFLPMSYQNGYYIFKRVRT